MRSQPARTEKVLEGDIEHDGDGQHDSGAAAGQIAFGKLTQQQNPQAAMDPQQRQQQQMMTFMMPVMFFFLFQSFPAAFMLYWLGTNVVYIAQQMWYNRTSSPLGTAEVVGTRQGGSLLSRWLPSGSRRTSGSEAEDSPSYQQRKASEGGKLTSKQEADKRRKKRRWPRRK